MRWGNGSDVRAKALVACSRLFCGPFDGMTSRLVAFCLYRRGSMCATTQSGVLWVPLKKRALVAL